MHQDADQRGFVWMYPGWMKYEVWVFSDMALLNFSGILQSVHGGHRVGYLDQLLVMAYPGWGWRDQYCRMRIESVARYAAGFRSILLAGSGFRLLVSRL